MSTATLDGEPQVDDESTAAPEPEAPELPSLDEADVAAATSTAVVITTPAGSLSLDPHQEAMNDIQKAALSAITNADPNDEAARPFLRTFLHVCQRLGLDPWAKQAYLIKRGDKTKRNGRGDPQKETYTIQVGIDGYRAIADRTGRLRGAVKWYWTGADDDPDSWYIDRDERTGMVVRRRVWFDEWPESRNWPGAAMAVVEHYDRQGEVVFSDAVAHWTMYAPLKEAWEDKPNGSGRQPKMRDGKRVMELPEMWEKGAAHMLAKCAEALVLRKVFPDHFAGTVTPEEMSRADLEEKRREAAEAAKARKAFADRQRSQRVIEAEPGATTTAAAPASTGASTGPATDPGAAATSPAADPAPGGLDEGTARRWLLAELNVQAELMGAKVGALCKRQIAARKQNVEDFPLTALSTMVLGFRPMIVERLRQQGKPAEADRYGALDPEPVEDVPAVLAGEEPAEPVTVGAAVEEVVADLAGGGEAPVEVDEPHPFVYDTENDSPECAAPGCGLFADDPVHEMPSPG